ncbi:MAG: hypothetical protein ACI4WH_02840 [Oscillospiraceae bacterium]
MKAGSKGIALALAYCNLVIPDMLPLVDEIFTVIVVVIPVYKEYKATGSIFKSVKAGVQSHQKYKNLLEEVVNGNIQVLNDEEYNEDVNTYQDKLPENSNINTQIKELNQLKLDGIINEDEFNKKNLS